MTCWQHGPGGSLVPSGAPPTAERANQDGGHGVDRV